MGISYWLKKNNALRYQWNSKDVVHSLFSPCSGVQRPSKAPHCRRWKLSFASKHSMSRSGKVDAEGAGPGESLAEFVLHQWVDPKMRGILWYTVPQKLAYCSPMVNMFETRIIPWYWGYSNFLQVLYDIIWYYMLFLLSVQSADTFQFTDRVGMGWPGTNEHFCNTEMLNFTVYASDIIRLYTFHYFFEWCTSAWIVFPIREVTETRWPFIIHYIVDYFWTRDEHSLSVGWSLFLLDDPQIDHPQFYPLVI